MSNDRKALDAFTQARIICQERERYLRELKLACPTPTGANKVYQTILYIHQHVFEETCTVQHLRDELGIHDHNFSSLFKYKVHVGIKEYITHHRLELAKRLLSLGDYPFFKLRLR